MKTTDRYEQLITTVPKRMYWDQCSNSKVRGHNPPTYTKQELIKWVTNQPNFQDLYNNWKASDYSSDLRPSCDRLDNSKGYSLTNIELVTWAENKRRANADVIAGTLGDYHKPVYQYTLEGVFIEKYISQAEAERITGTNQQNISACCRNLLTHTNRFRWFFEAQSTIEPIEVNNNYDKPIYCYIALTGELVDIYPSLFYVVEDGFSPEKVRSVITGEYESHKDHFWSFEELLPAEAMVSNTYLPTDIYQYTKSGALVATFTSMSEASKSTGVGSGNISKCCNGKAKSAGGFIWKRK